MNCYYILSKTMLTRITNLNHTSCARCGKTFELGQAVVSTGGKNRKLRHKECFEACLIEA